MLKTIVEDVDRYGVKKHLLRKTSSQWTAFFARWFGSNTKIGRFEKNRDEHEASI